MPELESVPQLRYLEPFSLGASRLGLMIGDIRAESELRLYDKSPATRTKDRRSFLEHASSRHVPSGCHWTPMT